MTNDPYASMRWDFDANDGLAFDDRYRLAQLPLIAPDHPRAIRGCAGTDYRWGRYKRARTSLVADLGEAFLTDDICSTVLDRLADLTFTEKIAFDLVRQRASVLHATVIGDVHTADLDPVTLAAVRDLLAAANPLRPTVHGPFVGRFNVGRMYLPLEFTERTDRDLIQELAALLGRTPPQFTAVGIVNLTDELNTAEATALGRMIDALAGPLGSWTITKFSWMTTHDDLTLDASRLEIMPIGRPRSDARTDINS